MPETVLCLIREKGQLEPAASRFLTLSCCCVFNPVAPQTVALWGGHYPLACETASLGCAPPAVASTYLGSGPVRWQSDQEKRCQECSSPGVPGHLPQGQQDGPQSGRMRDGALALTTLCTGSGLQATDRLALAQLSLNIKGLIPSSPSGLSSPGSSLNKCKHAYAHIYLCAYTCMCTHTCTHTVNVAPRCHTDMASTFNSLAPNRRQV